MKLKWLEREVRGQTQLLDAETKAKLFGLVAAPEEDTARQEFKDDCDTNKILARFGTDAYFGPGESGVVDYTQDFRVIADAARDAREAFERLPIKVRRGFAGWQDYLAAVARGEADLPPFDKPAAAAAGSSGAADGGSPSDSAAGEGAGAGEGG